MIAYLDTSALVPLLVDEPGSPSARHLWDAADSVSTSRSSYVEAAAALARAHRLARLSDNDYDGATAQLVDVWSDVDVVDLDQPLAERAAALADRFALRGYDAVQCASAELLFGHDLVAAAGDRALLTAWASLGLATYDVGRP